MAAVGVTMAVVVVLEAMLLGQPFLLPPERLILSLLAAVEMDKHHQVPQRVVKEAHLLSRLQRLPLHQ